MGMKKRLVDLREWNCRYPVTEAPPHLFCGGPCRAGSPYCEQHHAICYRPTTCADDLFEMMRVTEKSVRYVKETT